MVLRLLGFGKDDGALKQEHSSLVLVVFLVDDQVTLPQNLPLFPNAPLRKEE